MCIAVAKQLDGTVRRIAGQLNGIGRHGIVDRQRLIRLQGDSTTLRRDTVRRDRNRAVRGIRGRHGESIVGGTERGVVVGTSNSHFPGPRAGVVDRAARRTALIEISECHRTGGIAAPEADATAGNDIERRSRGDAPRAVDRPSISMQTQFIHRRETGHVTGDRDGAGVVTPAPGIAENQ